jgi:hypothetical protein
MANACGLDSFKKDGQLKKEKAGLVLSSLSILTSFFV